MKYTCFKKTISKEIDEDIDKIEDIKSIFLALLDYQLTFSIKLLNGNIFDKARITKVDKDMFDYLVFTSGAKLNKQSYYRDVYSVELVVADNILAYFKPKASRWNLLDGVEW